MSGASPADVPEVDRVVLIPSFQARPGRGADLEERLQALAAASRAEDGCIEYTVHSDVADPDGFVLYEQWASQAVLDRHNQTPHVMSFVADFSTLLATPLQVRRLKRLTTHALPAPPIPGNLATTPDSDAGSSV